jgi:hypothetical protein
MSEKKRLLERLDSETKSIKRKKLNSEKKDKDFKIFKNQKFYFILKEDYFRENEKIKEEDQEKSFPKGFEEDEDIVEIFLKFFNEEIQKKIIELINKQMEKKVNKFS